MGFYKYLSGIRDLFLESQNNGLLCVFKDLLTYDIHFSLKLISGFVLYELVLN